MRVYERSQDQACSTFFRVKSTALETALDGGSDISRLGECALWCDSSATLCDKFQVGVEASGKATKCWLL